MGWVDGIIAQLSPRWALRREHARRQLDLLRGIGRRRRTFEAVGGGRLRKDMSRTSASADAAISGDLAALREHVRYQEYQHGLFAGPIRRIVNNVVGRGILLRATVTASDDADVYQTPKITQMEAERWNRLAERHYRRWSAQADMRLIHTFGGIQRLAQGALVRDGEVLVVGRTSARPGRPVPYCLELLEADRLGTPPGEINNPRIRHGIEYDDEGVPRTYFVLRQHPGENFAAAFTRGQYEEIPAFFDNGQRKVIHLFDPVRPEQTRGYSAFGPGLLDLQDLARYREATKYAAIMAASHVGAIETDAPANWAANFGTSASTDDGEDDTSRREYEFAPGEMWLLRPGEKVKFNDPAQPTDVFSAYSYDLLQGPANALDMPPEVLAQNWRDLNYSNARTILLQFYLSCWIRQDYLIGHLCQPVYAAWVAAAVAKGLLPAVHYGRRTDELLAAKWVPAVYRKWVDPAKEATGRETDLRTNVETLTDTVTEQGRDIDEHLEQRARELRRIKELEEQYGVKFSPAREPAAAPAPPAEEEEEEVEDDRAAVLQILRAR